MVEHHLGFTTKFVNEYMNFSANALPYLNACSSFTSEKMKDAFLKKTGNTGTYIGWTNPTSESARFPPRKNVPL